MAVKKTKETKQLLEIKKYAAHIHSKTKFKIFKLGLAITAGITSLINSVPVFANEWDFATDSKKQKSGAFSGLSDSVETNGASFYSVVFKLCILALLIGIISVGAGFALNRNGQKREDNKTHIIFVVIGGVLILGAGSILAIISGIAGGLVSK